MTVLELYPGMDPDYTVNKMYLDHLRTTRIASRPFWRGRSAAGQTMTSRIETGIPSQCAADRGGGDRGRPAGGRDAWAHGALITCWWAARRSGWSRIAPCPVLAVKADKGSSGRAEPTIKRIVVPIDLSTCSLDALEYAVQFAKPPLGPPSQFSTPWSRLRTGWISA